MRPCEKELGSVVGLERRNRVRLLGRKAEQLAAGDEQLQVRAGCEQLGQPFGSLDDVLEVVQEEQQRLVGDVVGESVRGPERLRCGLQHELRVAQRREWHPENTVRIPVGCLGGGLEAEPGLARPARPGQGQQAGVLEQVEHRRELVLPAEERCRRNRQVRAVQALQSREVSFAELVDPLRRREVLQPVLAQIAQLVQTHERSRRGRDKHLAAVTRGSDPRRPVDIDTDVPLVSDVRRPGMDPDPHPDRASRQTGDRVRSRTKRPRPCRKGDKEGVALRVDLDSPLRRKGLAHDPPVHSERLPVSLRPQLVQEPGRALNVGEEKSNGARRKVTPHKCHHAPEKRLRHSLSPPLSELGVVEIGDNSQKRRLFRGPPEEAAGATGAARGWSRPRGRRSRRSAARGGPARALRRPTAPRTRRRAPRRRTRGSGTRPRRAARGG